MQASRSVFAGFFHDPVREGETTTVPCGGLVCTILHLHICARATAGGDASSPCCVRSSARAKSTGAAVTDTCISEFGDVRGREWTTQRKNLMVFRGEHRARRRSSLLFRYIIIICLVPSSSSLPFIHADHHHQPNGNTNVKAARQRDLGPPGSPRDLPDDTVSIG